MNCVVRVTENGVKVYVPIGENETFRVFWSFFDQFLIIFCSNVKNMLRKYDKTSGKGCLAHFGG